MTESRIQQKLDGALVPQRDGGKDSRIEGGKGIIAARHHSTRH